MAIPPYGTPDYEARDRPAEDFMTRIDDWAAKAAEHIKCQTSGLSKDRIAAIIATYAEPRVKELEQERDREKLRTDIVIAEFDAPWPHSHMVADYLREPLIRQIHECRAGTENRAIEAEVKIASLVQQLAEQRAELTDTLSERFKNIPACYDTPVDHYREMVRRIVEDRDALKHRERALITLLREARREHSKVGESRACPAWDRDTCTCGADAWNAKIDEVLNAKS